jgi:hypothetical protein
MADLLQATAVSSVLSVSSTAVSKQQALLLVNLVYCLVIPMWINLAERVGHVVVVPHEERVYHGQQLGKGLVGAGTVTVCSLARGSPAMKQKTSWLGRRQPSSGFSIWQEHWNREIGQLMRLAFRGSRSFMFSLLNIGRVFMYPFLKSLNIYIGQ